MKKEKNPILFLILVFTIYTFSFNAQISKKIESNANNEKKKKESSHLTNLYNDKLKSKVVMKRGSFSARNKINKEEKSQLLMLTKTDIYTSNPLVKKLDTVKKKQIGSKVNPEKPKKIIPQTIFIE